MLFPGAETRLFERSDVETVELDKVTGLVGVEAADVSVALGCDLDRCGGPVLSQQGVSQRLGVQTMCRGECLVFCVRGGVRGVSPFYQVAV